MSSSFRLGEAVRSISVGDNRQALTDLQWAWCRLARMIATGECIQAGSEGRGVILLLLWLGMCRGAFLCP